MPITFEHVHFDYGSRRSKRTGTAVPILCDVDFTIQDNEFVAIIGHTGSGKSTLVEHINGLRHPTSGRVIVNGLDLSERGARKKVRRMVGYVSQYPEQQLFAETVFDDVSFGPRNIGFDAARIESSYATAMTQMGLDHADLREASPFELSGGQQRRVAFAGILAMEPRILVMDEPMAGLDPQGRQELKGIIETLHDQGRTIVMVSHSMEDVAELADRIFVMNEGCIYREGTREEIFAQATELRRIGLGVPESTRFARELAEAGFELPGTPYTLEELADMIAATYASRGGGDDGVQSDDRPILQH